MRTTKKLYQDKDGLYNKYWEDKLSIRQIAELCNCSRSVIWKKLKKHEIPIRSLSEARLVRYNGKRNNDKYYNKEWLEKKYSKEKLSIFQIAKLCGYSGGTIRDYLKRLEIPIRSRSEAIHLAKANHCNLSDEAKQWIDGELMGDACLYSTSKYSAGFRYGSKYPEYIQYVSETLKSFGIERAGKINKCYIKKGNCYGYNYASLSYPELLLIRERWYPEGKKIIPRDLKLTPLVLRQGHIGDGCLHHNKNQKSYINLATYGFSIEDVEWFKNELNKFGFKATRYPSNNAIHISVHSTKAFLDYIGKCPVECYKYKFNYIKGQIN